MLKIFVVIMLLSPGQMTPLTKRFPVDSYEHCISEISRIKDKAEELNSRGGAIAKFTVVAGCEFESETSDPA